ncbi:hypothetical protein [Acinetobacter silvestris]|uniref:Uncharacterized protein n=1 Tax=Acinetobacter silvestris TaxID=1977882 RepID=A0A1Y3CGY7_9GAMM|nr:hypothetical protein [Acinetobacter silvestris]OTG66396.1 hypothetical protein B9T28_03820 [Acinetobacter silvestris]
MLYQYHCACCNKIVSAAEKECDRCGSHHIRSPYGHWIFGLLACLVVVVVFKAAHIYLNQEHVDTIPNQPTLLDVLNQDGKSSGTAS